MQREYCWFNLKTARLISTKKVFNYSLIPCSSQHGPSNIQFLWQTQQGLTTLDFSFLVIIILKSMLISTASVLVSMSKPDISAEKNDDLKGYLDATKAYFLTICWRSMRHVILSTNARKNVEENSGGATGNQIWREERCLAESFVQTWKSWREKGSRQFSDPSSPLICL